eukprot:1139301-Pelagomonas_calceolata.AAC.1
MHKSTRMLLPISSVPIAYYVFSTHKRACPHQTTVVEYADCLLFRSATTLRTERCVLLHVRIATAVHTDRVKQCPGVQSSLLHHLLALWALSQEKSPDQLHQWCTQKAWETFKQAEKTHFLLTLVTLSKDYKGLPTARDSGWSAAGETFSTGESIDLGISYDVKACQIKEKKRRNYVGRGNSPYIN